VGSFTIYSFPVFDSGNSLWNREPVIKADSSADYYAKPFGSAIGEKAVEQMANIPELSCINYSISVIL